MTLMLQKTSQDMLALDPKPLYARNHKMSQVMLALNPKPLTYITPMLHKISQVLLALNPQMGLLADEGDRGYLMSAGPITARLWYTPFFSQVSFGHNDTFA